MPIYTIEQLRSVARSKDNRLADTNKYTDDWIDDKIDHAFETAESGKQVFKNEEIIDVKPFANDGVEKFVITPDEEVHAYYEVFTSHPTLASGKVENDNTISVTIDVDNVLAVSDDDECTITIRYFYYPHIPFESIFMESEVYHYWRHCLYVNIYGSLRDKENETYHQEQVDTFIMEGSFTIPNDFDEMVGMKGSFYIPMRY